MNPPEPTIKPWGDHSLNVSFAGLLFCFEGLSAEQVEPIVTRFDLGFPTGGVQPVAMCIRVGRLDFTNADPNRYRGLEDNYTPVIEKRGEDTLWVEGMDFRGSIRLGDTIDGKLYTAQEERLVDPMVVENYLRILTAYAALRAGGLMFHSAAVVVDGRTHLFIGRSNAGKTTMSRLALAAGAEVLSDDANLLLPDAGGVFRAGPIPFAGELGQTACKGRQSYPVAGIYWLGKSEHTVLHELSTAQAYSKLMVCCPTVNVDDDQSAGLDRVLRRLLDGVPMYQLDFSLEDCFDEIFACIIWRQSN
jgi:hypothetical protein